MSRQPVAVVGLFDSAQALVDAIPRVKEKNLGALNAYTPYPVHGLDRALGIGKSKLGYVVFAAGCFGLLLAIGMQGWMNAVDYPQVVGGKPFFAWPAYIPIMFELMVLVAATTTFLGMIGLFNRLPFFGHPLLPSGAIADVTRDRFALVIERRPKHKLDLTAAENALLTVGGHSIEVLFPSVVQKAKSDGDVPFFGFATVGVAVVVAVFAGWATHWVVKTFPEAPPMSHMLHQAKLLPQTESLFFADGMSMRPPPEGSVARGYLPYPYEANRDDELAGRELINPMPVDKQTLEHGKEMFETQCAVCHGTFGDGKPMLSEQYMAQPANLHTQRIRDYPAGRLFHVMTVGKGAMPAYGPFIEPDDRWAIVHYVRALQRALNATDEELNAMTEELGITIVQPKKDDTKKEVAP